MLLTLGQRRAADDVVDLLLECHHRIRRFTAMAVRLGREPGASEPEAQTVAGQIRRYFAEALPLHMADEDRDVAPRLVGRDAAIDAALTTMSGDHVEHAETVARLIAVCAAVEREPRHLPAVAAELAALADDLEARFADHLALEERVVFPALRALPQAERDALRDAMRARRLPPT